MKNYYFELVVFLMCVFTSCAGELSKSQGSIILTIQGMERELAEHPRLLFSKSEEAEILDLAERNPLLCTLIDTLYHEADKFLKLPLQEPNDLGETDLGKSREQIARMIILGLAYRLSGDHKYVHRLEEELVNVCNYKSWHPEHFLDVAEMTTAVAIAYDWGYEELSDVTRDLVVRSIVHKAFEPAMEVYEKGDDKSWAKRNTNWNVVCNTGLLNGAIAIAESVPEEASAIIDYAIQFTPNNIEYFAPHGVYYEGPAYWNYTCSYLMLLLDNLDRNFGDDFGLAGISGVEETVDYYIRTLSPTNKVFNFADAGGIQATYSPVYFYWSQKYKQPEVADFYRNYLQDAIHNKNINFPRFFFLSIPWFDPVKTVVAPEKEKMIVFEGEPDMLVFNGGDENVKDEDDLFFIIKGGAPDMAHNQMDVGSFILEDQGMRWGIDLGSDKYSLPSFWDYRPDGVRWQYFRNNNLSHSTINIDRKIAYSKGRGRLKKWRMNIPKPFGVFDLTSSYQDQAHSVTRGVRLLSPYTILCQDEATLTDDYEVLNWRFITDAEVSKEESIIRLNRGSKSFYLKPIMSNTTEIHIFEAQNNSPQEKPVTGVTIIEVSSKKDVHGEVSNFILMGRDLKELEYYSTDGFKDIYLWE